jgi:hypothetical protein
MYRKVAYFALGAVAGPLVANLVKPAFRSVLKGAFIIAHEAKIAALQVREEIKDVSAEAAAAATTEASNGTRKTIQ